MELFNYEYPPGSQEVDETNTTTLLLYYSEEEQKEMKALAKIVMKKEYGVKYQEGNLSDLILKLQRAHANS